MLKPKDILTKKVLQIEYIENKLSIQTIATKYKIKSVFSVFQAIKRHNLYRDTSPRSNKLTYEIIYKKYVIENKSIKEVAYETGFSDPDVIKRTLKKFNIEIRKHTYTDKQKLLNKGFKGINGKEFSKIKCSATIRKLEFNITAEYIWYLYKKQKSRCALSNRKIYLKHIKSNMIKTASLDRIDSTKGYIKGNVQWVHVDINYMKSDLPENEFIKLCSDIVRHTKNRYIY